MSINSRFPDLSTPAGYLADGSLCTCECHTPGVTMLHFMACCGFPPIEPEKQVEVVGRGCARVALSDDGKPPVEV
jgi:hypothetical protein